MPASAPVAQLTVVSPKAMMGKVCLVLIIHVMWIGISFIIFLVYCVCHFTCPQLSPESLDLTFNSLYSYTLQISFDGVPNEIMNTALKGIKVHWSPAKFR